MLVAQAPRPSMQEPAAFRSVAELVRIHVAVRSRDGDAVVDLRPSDFSVYEDGESRPISVFVPPRDEPIEVVLAMDASGSMGRWPSRKAFTALLDSLHPQSCVLLLPFREQVLRAIWGHPADPGIRRVIEEIEQDGDEAVYDALLEAFHRLRDRSDTPHVIRPGPGYADLLRFRSPGWVGARRSPRSEGACVVPSSLWASDDALRELRRAVVIITDEPDRASSATLSDVLLAAWGSGIPVFGLASTERPRLRTSGGRSRGAQLGHLRALEELAKHTGGVVIRRTMEPRDWPTAAPLLEGVEQLSAALRGSYLLGYVPAYQVERAETAHFEAAVDVKVIRDDVDVVFTSSVARGRGQSEGAALDVALRAFRSFAEGRTDEARRGFEVAVNLSPELGLTHYGRGIVLAEQGLYQEAISAFDAAQRRAPWLPDLDARIAAASLETGNTDDAWSRAMAAHAAGSDVSEIVARLQEIDPREASFERPGAPRRVLVRSAGGGDLATLFAAPRVTTAVYRLLLDAPSMVGTPDVESSDLVLTITLTEASARGSRVTARGWLVVERLDGTEVVQESFSIRRADSVDDLRAQLAPRFERIVEAVALASRD